MQIYLNVIRAAQTLKKPTRILMDVLLGLLFDLRRLYYFSLSLSLPLSLSLSLDSSPLPSLFYIVVICERFRMKMHIYNLSSEKCAFHFN